MANVFRVTLDSCEYTSKPDKTEVGRITVRMKQNGSTELDAAQLLDAIRHGRTWCGGCFAPSAGDWGEFQSMQICAVDIDNSTKIIGADGKPVKGADGHILKRPLFPGEAGYLDRAGALARCKQLGLQPLALYDTMSCKDWWPKFRIMFDLGEAVCDEQAASAIVAELVRRFPECDRGCSNLNRLFFASNGTVYEIWRGERP